jgi:hypothetical protein
MKQVLRLLLLCSAAGIIAGCAGGTGLTADQAQLKVGAELQQPAQQPAPATSYARQQRELLTQPRLPLPCINEFCWRESYDLAWEQYYDYPVSYRTKQIQYDRNQLEYGYLRRGLDFWEPSVSSVYGSRW